ncbi:MAG: hypothetical protein ACK4LQ_07820 [Pararhodobacter sp.]
MTLSRQEIEELLVLHVNGTTTPEETAEIDTWLARDPVLAAEREALAQMRQTLRDEPLQSPGEFGLARLLRDVEREARQAPVATTPTAAANDAANGAANDNAPRRMLAGARLWQIAAVLALALFAGQTAWMLRDSGPRYELVGAAEGPVAVVAFTPEASEAAIRALLLDLDLEIVAGPSALGLYRLRAASPEALPAALDALRAATAVVESAEAADE